ncbi:hypothetical protein TNCV_1696611 [Trichonephila clavipes]|nr:hypothetical protein TNCV_1696611 [Trichonephila clavipes]
MLPVLGKKAVLEWCMEEGLIGSSYVCPKCGKSMGKKERLIFNAKLFVVPGLEHWTRVHNHDHPGYRGRKENSKFERNVMEKYIEEITKT